VRGAGRSASARRQAATLVAVSCGYSCRPRAKLASAPAQLFARDAGEQSDAGAEQHESRDLAA